MKPADVNDDVYGPVISVYQLLQAMGCHWNVHDVTDIHRRKALSRCGIREVSARRGAGGSIKERQHMYLTDAIVVITGPPNSEPVRRVRWLGR